MTLPSPFRQSAPRHPMRVLRFPDTGLMQYTCQSCGHRNETEWRVGFHECSMCHYAVNRVTRAAFVWDGTKERPV